MTIVKSNLCKQCGGLLDIDIDRQVYICPFCGVTFDYEYFREDNVKEIARKSISRREFGAAKDAFDFMLKKDPHDFDALLGLFLCRNRWLSIHPITNSDNIQFKEDDATLKYVIDNCLPEDKAYFEKIREVAGILEKYRNSRRELAKLEGARSVQESVIKELDKEYHYNEHRFSIIWDSIMSIPDKNGFPLVLDLVPITLVILVGIIVARVWWFLIFLAIVIIIAVAVYNIKKAIVRNSIKAERKPAREKLDQCINECNEKNQEGNELMKEFRQKSKAIIMERPMEKPAEINHR